MSHQLIVILGVAAMLVVYLVFAGIWASRYAKVGPNQVLIVSGRKIQLPDGTHVGYRIVKGGGTFVFPVIEKVDVLSLEVMAIEMPRSKAQVAGGRAVETDCVAQVKINNDDVSVLRAIEHFQSKSQAEIKDIVRPVLEKHLSSVLANSSVEETSQNPAACAARVQTVAAQDLRNMGLSMISFTIRNSRAV